MKLISPVTLIVKASERLRCFAGSALAATVTCAASIAALALLLVAALNAGFAHAADPALTNVIQLAARFNHTCAREADGTVKCWGENSAGQLGNGGTAQASAPVAVTGLSGVVTQLVAGFNHTCAVDGGRVKCWGRNDFGQLGNGSTTDSLTPVAITGLTGPVTQLVAGGNHTCAVDGSMLKCWGYNVFGQLGNGSTLNSTTPVAVTGLAGSLTQLAAGGNHTCAVDGGTVKCWGDALFAQLGLGDRTSRTTPEAVTGFSGAVTQIVAGNGHTCALEAGGTVKCWGRDSYDQLLGRGPPVGLTTPRAVSGFAGAVTQLAAGGNHTCALEADGTVKCWGFNSSGQLGVGNTTTNQTPAAVRGFAGVVTGLAGGSAHTCAIETGGTVKCWGLNSGGQLGIGTLVNADVPQTVICPSCNPDVDGDGIPNAIEGQQGTNPLVKDNDIFASTDAGRRLFVMQMYRDLLGREADAAGLAFWTAELAAGRQTRGAMVSSFLFAPEADVNATQAGRLYFAAFLRSPDAAGQTFWTNFVASDGALAAASAFAHSSEFINRYGNLDNAGFIDRLYRNVLGRPADAAGLAFWIGQMGAPTNLTRGQVLLHFANSPEYRTAIDADVQVARLYLAMLKREPDTAGLAFWANRVESGGSLAQLIDSFITAPEYRGRFLP